MLTLVLWMALGTLGDVDQALVLYDAALYQSALETLPADCGQLDDDMKRCFRVKGLCEVALNQKNLALQSWTNMCLLELAAAPPPLAPTSVELWNRACENARWLSRFRLDELATQNDRAKIVIKRPGGPGQRLAGIRFWFKTPVNAGFESIELLKQEGSLWSSGEVVPVIPGPYEYYLDFKLAAGEAYRSGSPKQPYQGKAVEYFETRQFSALTNPWPGQKEQEAALIPDWGWWAIAGGVVIIVATSVAIGVSASQDAP